MAATPDGGGYWLVGPDGGIFAYGDAGFFGSAGGCTSTSRSSAWRPRRTAVATGWWRPTAASSAYGDAGFFGSAGSLRLNAPIVGMAATPDGGGYWLVASDGGIFSYGDAAFHGSAGSLHLNAARRRHGGDARAAAATGWWRATAASSATATPPSSARPASLSLNAPVTGMASTSDGDGYWLVARDGGIFTYGDASYSVRSGGTALPGPVVGLATAPDGAGYWLVVGSQPLAGEVVGIDPGHNGLNYSAPGVIDAPVFNGTGTEPCDTTGTATDSGYTEAQFNFNVATYLQGDLQAEGATVVLTRPDNQGVGPCVTTRAAIINNAHADVAVDIHADGGPADGRGFAVLDPTRTAPTTGSSPRRPPSPPRCATPSRRARPCRSAPTTGSTGCSPATTWPASTSRRCPRC